MNAIKKILVPVDFGELTLAALEKAIGFAEAMGGTVTVLHVYEYSLWGVDGGPDSALGAARRIRLEAENALEALLRQHREGKVEVTGVIREGIPWSETLNYARETSADLIVMGTHGRQGLPRALLGSVSEKVVRFAPIPVLTIRGPAPDKTKTKTETSPKGAVKLRSTHHDEEVLAVSGAVAGAATGAIAGPPGVVAGAVIGAAVGMAVGKTLDNQDARKQARDEELDRQIGVSEGDLGAALPNQPPARSGAYSAGSAGVLASTPSPSEGPMQNVDED